MKSSQKIFTFKMTPKSITVSVFVNLQNIKILKVSNPLRGHIQALGGPHAARGPYV